MSSFSDIIETGKDVLGKDYAKKPVNIKLNTRGEFWGKKFVNFSNLMI